MEYLLKLLNTVLDDPQTVRMVFIGLVAVAVTIVGVAVVLLIMSASDPVRRRLRSLHHESAPPKRPHYQQGFTRAMDIAAPLVVPKEGWERSKIAARLVHAGFRGPNAITVFFVTKVLLAVLLPSIWLIAVRYMPQLTTTKIAFGAAGLGFFGLTLPNMFVTYRYERRMNLLRNGFPDALDLLVVCVEAGLGLAAAIQRVGDELAISHPELAAELSIVNAEIRAGMDRVQALHNLATRTGLDDIRGLVSLLAQSVRFGTSIAETLRVYAEEFRDKRMQRAEEKAAMIGTKLIFPLVLCLFPSFFVVMVGPALLGVMAAMGK